MSTPEVPGYTKKDFSSGLEVRWCPGCGDYAILNAVQTAFAAMGVPRENFVIVSGIGCSSRFPYYMETYGIHGVHGRAPTLATGIKLARPELDVWVVTGDGDGLAIGGNHLMHALRRNVGLKILMFNNRIYGLTKGQYSPTSEQGKVTASTPLGSIDPPFEPLSLVLGAGATFVARTADRFKGHLQEMIHRAARHRGAAFIEILQNCNIFNDGAWSQVTGKQERVDNVVYLEQGKPLRFGEDGCKALILEECGRPKVVDWNDGADPRLIVHDETLASPSLAFLLSHLAPPEFPLPLGVLRDVSAPAFEDLHHEQIRRAEQSDSRDLAALLAGPSTWTVE
ncbi:MAG: 2-oxoacid:ferredoxin oxidoreductase subunit beta [Acidobacteriota bacterium]|nr:2-oxoacid:ferredoxin oxidoreductase subunit beta [Acidobacteriota bacterium]MDQ7087327.1 2-oxoacid:ferredoxin oxidoreductase subunit beta [Acidobacteriota bacterium]